VLHTEERANEPMLARAVVLGGAAVTLLGVVLPWIQVRIVFGRVSVSGIDTNPGKLSMGAAIFAGLLVLFASATTDAEVQRVFQGLCLLPGATIVFLAAFNLQDVGHLETSSNASTADVGSGLWVTLLGGLVLLGGAIAALMQTARPTPPPSDGPPPPFWFPGSVPPSGDR
jgi:hypothetical protein